MTRQIQKEAGWTNLKKIEADVVYNDWYDTWETYFVWHDIVILSFTANISSFIANKDG